MVLDRRGFMQFALGAGAGIMATPVLWKLADDVSIWSQNWPWIPANQRGETTYVTAVSKNCPSCVGMKVRLVDGRPVRILPNAEHPLGGGVSALAETEVQMLHSPARVRHPLKRTSDGAYVELSWEEAEKLVIEKLKGAGAKTAFICGDENSSTAEVVSAFAAGLGSGDVFLMPSDAQAAARACDLMGLGGQLGYDLENSDYVLAIGANILESWGTVVRNRRIFAKATPHPSKDSASSLTLAYAGPVQNNTAAVAKPWLPILPGTEIHLALGIANMLMAKGKSLTATDAAAFKTLVAAYTPEYTAKITGLPAAMLTAVVEGLLKAKSPLVIMGSALNHGSGASPVMVGFAVNDLLGNIGKKGGVSLLREAPAVLANAKTRAQLYKKDLAAYLDGKQTPAALVLYEANPVYALPDPVAVKASLAKIPFKVAITTLMDESAMACDLVLPVAMGLERIDDILNPYGCGKSIYCVTPSVTAPPAKVVSGGDLFFALAKKLGLALGVNSYVEVLKKKATAMSANYDLLVKGQPVVSNATASVASYAARADIIGKALQTPKPGQLQLALYSKLNLGTAKTGIPPFNPKTIRATELVGHEMTVMVNKATATRIHLAENDRVRVSLPGGGRFITARLRVFEGVTSDTVAVCLGYGHTALDEFSQNKGANVMQLLTAAAEPDTGLTAWAGAAVDIAKA